MSLLTSLFLARWKKKQFTHSEEILQLFIQIDIRAVSAVSTNFHQVAQIIYQNCMKNVYKLKRVEMALKYSAVKKIFEDRDKRDSKWKVILDDIFWPMNVWPQHLVLNLFNCEYSDRVSIISFLYKNAFPDHYAFDFIKFYARPSKNGTPWEVREKELKSVWARCKDISLFGNAIDQEKYFFYSMAHRVVFNYAGQKKLYGRVVNTHITANNRRIEQPKSDEQHFKSLLNTNEEFEFEAGELAAEAAVNYEKQVLNAILDEIRNMS